MTAFRRTPLISILLSVILLGISRASFSYADPLLNAPAMSAPTQDLTALSLEQLATMEVTSVSRKPERASTAAAAVFVITSDDIRRAGATSLADALRLAPGVEVAQINASQWSIGIRGFGSRLARSVLDWIDGRSVYSPLFAGTYWEMQDVLLEDVERIEVIRGPGGTLWGDNAVNGVINIITKSAKDTPGSYLSAGGGSQEKAFGEARYGASIGDNFHYRVYGQYWDRGADYSPTGNNFDAWNIGQGGFRSDWEASSQDNLTVQGDVYDGAEGENTAIASYTPPYAQTLTADGVFFGANLLSRWKHQFDDGSDMSLQTYYDRTDRNDPDFLEIRNTADLDFQHHIPIDRRNDFIWGFEYRYTENQTDSLPTLFFDPTGRTESLGSLFLQDDIALVERRLTLTLGSKFEHNDYSGWENQPNARLAWTPDDQQTLWTSVSRALRTPSATDQDLSLTVPFSATSPTFARVIGNPNFDPEQVLAYEAGYRIQPVEPLFLDLDAFYNVYRHLESIDPGSPFSETTPGGPATIYPYTIQNDLRGQTHGIEFSSTYFITPSWKLKGDYSFLSMGLTAESGSSDTTSAPSTNDSSPRHQVQLQSLMSLPHGFELDPTARYVDNLSASGNVVPAYWSCDLHLGWHATRHIELSLVGQNLLQTHHPESGTTQEIERGIYGRVTFRSW